MLKITEFNKLLVEAGSRYAKTNYCQINGNNMYVGLPVNRPKDRYNGLVNKLKIGECIENGYFAIYKNQDTSTSGVLAFIFGTEQEREDFVKNHPDSKYDLTDLNGFKAMVEDGWTDIYRYLIDSTNKVIVYDDNLRFER